MTNKKLWQIGTIDAVGTGVYVALVSALMSNAQKIFGQGDNVLTGMAILMLLVLSAAVVGTFILGRPLMMYLDGAKKEAVRTLIYTLIILFAITLIVMIVLSMMK